MIIIFYPVRLKCYLVGPQTKVHPGFKRGEEICSFIRSDFTTSFHSEPRNMVCGGKTYTVTQIQTFDSDNFCLSVTLLQVA